MNNNHGIRRYIVVGFLTESFSRKEGGAKKNYCVVCDESSEKIICPKCYEKDLFPREKSAMRFWLLSEDIENIRRIVYNFIESEDYNGQDENGLFEVVQRAYESRPHRIAGREKAVRRFIAEAMNWANETNATYYKKLVQIALNHFWQRGNDSDERILENLSFRNLGNLPIIKREAIRIAREEWANEACQIAVEYFQNLCKDKRLPEWRTFRYEEKEQITINGTLIPRNVVQSAYLRIKAKDDMKYLDRKIDSNPQNALKWARAYTAENRR